MPGIAISYRREDTGWITGRIFDRLKDYYEKAKTKGDTSRPIVFMDYDSTPIGVDFRKFIKGVLDECDVLLAIIGPRWSGDDGTGSPRILQESDWVRIEIETALANDIPVVPILIDRTPMPSADKLPEGVRELVYRQAAIIDTQIDFNSHVDRLIREIDRLLGIVRPSLTESEGRGFCRGESCIWQDSLFSMRRAEMGLPKSGDAASRFSGYVEGLTSVIGHADRAKPLRDYCTGLMMPCGRKSVEPMAAVTAPERTSAQHQSLLHFVGEGNWCDEKVLAKVREMVLPEVERHGPIEAWIIDDTGFPKKGRHSVGVARQYCGELGKQDNCQIAVTLSIANHYASLPVAYRLYLPKEWATDGRRRRKAGVPKEVTFKTKPAIALEQLRWACATGLPRGVVLMDAGYGTDTDLRTNIAALGLSYVAGIQPQTSVWAPGTGPQPAKNWSGHGRPPKLLRRDGKHQPISVKKLAIGLPPHAWRKITWRETTAEPLSSRFARVRVRAAHRDYWLAESRPEEWLLIEWPEGEEVPTKYWFATLPAGIAFRQLIDTAKLRWRIERDYQDLKQEVGLGHFEGRGWRGFHHHATLCIAAYGFLVSQRGTIPPSGTGSARLFKEITIPETYRPRGSAIAA